LTDLICDLDGVLYLGSEAIPGVAEAAARFRGAGGRMLFVTNNAGRTPAQVADKIRDVAGVEASTEEVVTSAMAVVGMTSPADDPVLVVGEAGITEILGDAGRSFTDDPRAARSVVVGIDRGIDYQRIARAAEAVRSGARFIATNLDPTIPVESGLLPGAGAIVAAIQTASGFEPEVAGKPYRPMRDVVRRRFPGPAWLIGDRLDTDIAMAEAEPEWTSILVLTGATREPPSDHPSDLVVAGFPEAIELILAQGGVRRA
jgi:glycerol-1-phosphatase